MYCHIHKNTSIFTHTLRTLKSTQNPHCCAFCAFFFLPSTWKKDQINLLWIWIVTNRHRAILSSNPHNKKKGEREGKRRTSNHTPPQISSISKDTVCVCVNVNINSPTHTLTMTLHSHGKDMSLKTHTLPHKWCI